MIESLHHSCEHTAPNTDRARMTATPGQVATNPPRGGHVPSCQAVLTPLTNTLIEVKKSIVCFQAVYVNWLRRAPGAGGTALLDHQ